jgi:hypothetical protein
MSSLESLRQLLQLAHHARPEDLPEMAMRAAPLVDATVMVIYLVDYQRRVLLPLLGGSAPEREPINVDGTLPGRAFTSITTCVTDHNATARVPIIDGSERMGILDVVADRPLEDDAINDCTAVATLLAGRRARSSSAGWR